MRESFVFHAEYINDLPEEYKARFAMYAINYGLQSEEPTLEGLELTIWLKIKRRIDSDLEAWEETKAKRSEAGKKGGAPIGNNNASKAKEENKQKQPMVDLVVLEQANQTKQAVNVNDSLSVVCSGVNVSVATEEESSEASADITIFQKLKELDLKYSLNLTKSQINKITATLSANNLDYSFLDYVAVYILKTYKELNPGLFYSAVCTWDNLRTDFSSAKPKIKKKIPDLDSCMNCGASSLVWINPDSRHCKECHSDYLYRKNKWSLAT